LSASGIFLAVSVVLGTPCTAFSWDRPIDARMAAMIAQITATTSADHPRPMALPRPHHSDRQEQQHHVGADARTGEQAGALACPLGRLADLRLGELDLLAHQRGDVTADLTEELADRGE